MAVAVFLGLTIGVSAILFGFWAMLKVGAMADERMRQMALAKLRKVRAHE